MEPTHPNKKVLIVTYYWPPSGGSGVQRWLKFVKYLHRAGWEPIVFTPENPSFTIQDPSLQKDVPPLVEVWRLPIWEPYGLFAKVAALFGKKGVKQTDFISTGNKSFFQKVSTWLRGNFFIPDPRLFWVRPATQFLTDLIRSNQIEKIITTGPPHSIHLIGLRLKKKNQSLQWIADFRDPWSEWDLLDTLSLTKWARKKHQRLERRVLQTADKVVTIAPFHVKRLEALGGRPVDLITNGFDEDDFPTIPRVVSLQFTIRHIGIVDELRDPRPAMLAIKELLSDNPEMAVRLRIEFIGQVNSLFKQWVMQDNLLNNVTSFVDYVPHSELLKIYASTNLQLLVLAHTVLAPGNLPGKFFEYLASRNRILAIGPVEGDAADVLNETKAGKIFDRSDLKGMKKFVEENFLLWNSGQFNESAEVAKYTRRALTKQLISLLES
ncbi:MAG: glycosyltransferase family 4 protein [Bacteroidota bacterium]